MRLEWLPAADNDVDNILEFIAADNPFAAVSQGDEILTQTSSLIKNPEMGRKGRVAGTRELVIMRTPFIAVYRTKGSLIQILRIMHGAREWPESF
ncbi:MAG: type II toxin-antitoxin system RelE/ParE family toxin [Desulfuromonadales bacterium]|nr:type II toxin-antitoxin system RelE/ParE family toxin [Desulfuromonadales bacterium]